VPTNGSDHGVETDLEQLHGAGLPVSISRHTAASVGRLGKAMKKKS